MEGMKVIYKQENLYLCTPAEVPLRPEKVLENLICPFPKIPFLYGEFEINGEVMKGYTISQSPRILSEFWKTHALDKKPPFDSIDPQALDDTRERSSLPEFVVLRHENDDYIFKKADIIALHSWLEEEGKIRPVLCGGCNAGTYNFYFYFSGYTEKNAIFRTTEHYCNIPKPIREGLVRSYRCLEVKEPERYGWIPRKMRLRREIYGPKIHPEDELVDLLPYPPYRVVHAIKLLPPGEIEKSEALDLPDGFKEEYILKTFLYSLEPLPVSVLSPGQLKKIAGYIHSPLYLPDTPNEDPLSEYSQVWEKSAGYLLWCKPNWPFEL